MNRFYQGKVGKAELLDAKGNDITPKEWDWESALWDHHALFQDAENKIVELERQTLLYSRLRPPTTFLPPLERHDQSWSAECVNPDRFRVNTFARLKIPENECYGYSIVESEEFAFSKALIGEPQDFEDAMNDLHPKLQANPMGFRVVELPNIRMAKIIVANHVVTIHFRIVRRSNEIELLWSAVS